MLNVELPAENRGRKTLVVTITGFLLLKAVLHTTIPCPSMLSPVATIVFAAILFFVLLSNKLQVNGYYFGLGLLYLLAQIPIALILPTWMSSMSIFKSVLFLWLGYLAFFVFISGFYLKESDIRTIFRSFVILVMILCCINLYINGADMVRFIERSSVTGKINFASIFANRNSFGFYLYFAFAQALYLYGRNGRKKYLVTLLLITLNLLFTLSRASILSTLVFFVVFVCIYSKQSWYQKLSIGGVVFGFGILALNIIPVFGNLWSGIVRGGTSGRTELWIYGLNLFLENPLLGRGYGSSGELLMMGGISLKTFHNSYMNILVDGGIVFLVMYVFLIVHLISVSMAILKHDRLAGATFLSLTISYCVYSFFEANILFSASSTASTATVILVALPILYYRQLVSIS